MDESCLVDVKITTLDNLPNVCTPIGYLILFSSIALSQLIFGADSRFRRNMLLRQCQQDKDNEYFPFSEDEK